MRKGLVRKIALFMAIIIVAWIGARLTFLSLDYTEEVFSLTYFELTIVNIRMHNSNTMVVKLGFNNPTSRNVRILSIQCVVDCRDIHLGIRNIGFHTDPLVVEKYSEHEEEVFIEVRSIQDYTGEEIEIRAHIVIETKYHGNIPKIATYERTI